ncbi:Eukaryotic translation initiation factor 2 subunit 3 [Linnemannia zychae]|nr:Eukaryotic translation initiation factor 2 subunit 3 [Linnemannia zychae]
MPRKGTKASRQKVRKPNVEEATFEIECILGYRNIKGKQEFLVKWLGYPNTDNTWEPLENLDNCSFMVNEYMISFGIDQLRTRAQEAQSPHNPRPTVQDTFSRAAIMDAEAESNSFHSNIRSTLSPLSRSTSLNYYSRRSAEQSRDSTRSCSPDSLRLVGSETTGYANAHTLELRLFERLFEESRGPRIIVENTVDDAGRPEEFRYINDSVYGPGVQPPNPDFIDSCSCAPGQCSVENGCDCMREAVLVNESGELPYDKDGRVTTHANKLLWECNSRCGCGPSCTWNYSQRPRELSLKIKRYKNKGWGVVLNQREPVQPRTFISRYVGEIITYEEAERRGRMQDSTGTTYLFDLDYNHEQKATYSIDACRLGNETHFINHSCDPNLLVYMLKSGGNGGDENLMTLSFWSNRLIEYGDELTFDYNGKFVPEWHKDYNSSQSQSTLPPGEGTTPCRCGAEKCREWVHRSS